MKLSKKLLSLLLAVVMIATSLSTVAFAWTATGDIIDTDKELNIKYTVAKADSAPMADGTATYEGDDIYAVTMWAQSNSPITGMTATVHYNKAHYAPIMLFDGDVTYPVGAEMDQDTWYSDMAEGTNYTYSYGSYMNDTGMYKANGAVATTKALARYIGMGNKNHDGIKTYSELISPDHPNFGRYSAGVDTDSYGMIYFSVAVGAVVKSAYFNTYHNGTTFAINSDWVDMGVLYFQRLPGVTDEDCVGDVFGNTAEGSFCMDGVVDNSGTLYCTTSNTKTVPDINLVSNATVEAAEKPELIVENYKQQIRFDKNGNDYAGTFDVRFLSTISNFEEYYPNFVQNEEDGANSTGHTIVRAGYLFNKDNAIVVEDALEQIASENYKYSQVDVKHIAVNYTSNNETKNYVLGAIVNNVDNSEAVYSAMAYVVYDDGAIAYAVENQKSFSGLYTQYYSQAFTA